MGERRANAGARETLGLVPHPVAARLGGHFHIHPLDQGAEARIERVPWMRQVDRDLADDAAGVRGEDEEAIAHLHRLLDVMSHHQHGLDGELPLAPEVEKIVAQRLGGQDIERRERLVHQQDVRMNYQRASKTYTLPHTAGELARIGGLEAIETDEVDGLQRAGARIRLRMAERFQTQLHILEHGQPREEREALKHHGDALGRAYHRLAEVVHRTTRWKLQPRDRPQQCRLPGTRASEQAHDLSGPERQIHILEHDELVAIRLAEGFADALHIEKGCQVHRVSIGVHRLNSVGICARRGRIRVSRTHG